MRSSEKQLLTTSPPDADAPEIRQRADVARFASDRVAVGRDRFVRAAEIFEATRAREAQANALRSRAQQHLDRRERMRIAERTRGDAH
jgi:hypothetical protein